MTRRSSRSGQPGNGGHASPPNADSRLRPFVSVDREPSPLLARARSYLESGPADSIPLIEHVCQLPGAPRAVAEQLAQALFTETADVQRGADGRWSLVRERAVAMRPTRDNVARSLDALSYVVVDVETTGGSPFGGDRITEFCAVTVINGEIVDVFETLINPQRPIPPAVTRLTRITWDMVRHAPTIREVASRIAEALRGHLFVAHNAAFDWRFVTSELSRFAGQQVSGERLCTVKLARAVVPNIRRRSLDALSYFYGIENHARHRAGGDALATAKVLLRLLAAARDRGCETLEDLRMITRVSTSPRKRRRRRGLPGWTDGEMTA
jgi:DNA polymerase-3 subunit epsilon